MARIIEYRDIPLEDLVIGQGQVRVDNPSKGVEDLAKSISTQGLLQPIVVCAAKTPGKWEILTGQRRFLAHEFLGKETIAAAVLDGRVEEGEAKAISITENLLRRQLSGKELKDGILYLYKMYGSVSDVVSATGLPQVQVRDSVKYPRLLPELKKMVDDDEVDINAAVRAQDASCDATGEPVLEIAIKLAVEMNRMSGVQRKRVTRNIKDNPDKPVDEVIEEAKSSAHLVQVVATVTRETHSAIRKVAAEDNQNQDEAVAGLIEEALTERGLLS